MSEWMLCGCGHRFPSDLGKHGCPNCCGDYGPADYGPAGSAVYDCHNHPRREAVVSEHEVQVGWSRDGRRIMRDHRTEWAVVQCGHDQPHQDAKCAGCFWMHNGDAE